MAFSGDTAADLDRVLRKPGRIVVAPSDLSAGYPYGGTYLGRTVSGLVLDWDALATPLVSTDEQGPEPYDLLFRGHGNTGFFVEFSEWDNDVLQVVLPSQTVAGATERKVQSPSGLVPSLLSSEAVTLLFAPRDDTASPSILIHSAVVLPAKGEWMFRLLRETGLRVRIFPLRSATAPTNEERFSIGWLEDLSLT